MVIVHHSEWISDYDSDWVPEEEKTYYPEEYKVYKGYVNKSYEWEFMDEYGATMCGKGFGEDKGTIYNVVVAWMPLPKNMEG